MARLGIVAIAAGMGYIYATKGSVDALLHPLILGTVFVGLMIIGLLKDA